MSTYRLKMPLRPSGDALSNSYNTALRILDDLVQTSVTAETNTPPAAPLVGASYLVGGSPSGVWSGQAGTVAVFNGTAWNFMDPPPGMMIFDVAADSHKRWTGSAWVMIAAPPPALVPVTAMATATGDGTIYTNEGDGDGATLTLPAAAAGLRVTVIARGTQPFTVTAGDHDTIRLAADETATGGSLSSAVVGSVVQLVAINAADTESSPAVPGEWIAVSIVGSWSL